MTRKRRAAGDGSASPHVLCCAEPCPVMASTHKLTSYGNMQFTKCCIGTCKGATVLGHSIVAAVHTNSQDRQSWFVSPHCNQVGRPDTRPPAYLRLVPRTCNITNCQCCDCLSSTPYCESMWEEVLANSAAARTAAGHPAATLLSPLLLPRCTAPLCHPRCYMRATLRPTLPPPFAFLLPCNV